MNGHDSLVLAMFILLVPLALIGCSPAAQTAEPAAESGYDGTVTYDGNGCLYSGPAELPVGRGSFLFENQTDLDTAFDFVYLRQEKTYQDLLDDQGEPGKYVSFPDYASNPTLLDITYDEPTGEYIHTFSLNQESVYVPLVFAFKPGGDVNFPEELWFCGPIQVVKANE